MPALDTESEDTTAIGQLVRDARRRETELLSRQEERWLLERYAETGDDEIRRKLVLANIGWALTEAAEWGGHLEYADAVSAALSGLLKGVESYDPDHPGRVRLISYATWWIRQALQRAEAREQGTVTRTTISESKRRKLQRRRDRLTEQLGRPPSDAEIREALDISARELRAIRRTASSHHVTRLDARMGDSEGASEWHKVFPGTDADSVAEPQEKAAEQEYLREVMDRELTAREALILRFRFGLEDGDTQTLREIGERLDLSRERIRQLEERALDKLRRCDEVEGLREAASTKPFSVGSETGNAV